MADDREPVEAEEKESFPEQLCGLLTEQVACARRGNIARVEQLGAQVDTVIAQMAPDQMNQPVMAESQRARLQKKYDELVLMLQAEQADVQTRLSQLRQVKRVVGAYNTKKRRR